jgi:hypothetical protein
MENNMKKRKLGDSNLEVSALGIGCMDSAALIEQSDLDFTILRPGWVTRDEEVSYHITQKGEAFEGHDVSLNSLSGLIVKWAKSPALHARCSLGISQA